MQRIKLINYRGHVASPDMAKALRTLETRASEEGWRLELQPSTSSPMAKAGREIGFQLRRSDCTPQQALNAAWALAVPLGFTPWARWPVFEGSPSDTLFHFLGPWQSVADNLLAEGRGHLAWPSVEAASLADSGTWTASHEVERFVQAQLHRVGKNPGPVDGVVGPRTLKEIESLALGRSSLGQTALHLKEMADRRVAQTKPGSGHVFVNGRNVVVQGVGGVAVQQHPHGAILAVTGPGRVLVDIGDLL